METNWRIVLAQHDMKLKYDQLLFGRDTCHSFIALQNPEGDTISEIHGTTFHPRLNRVGYGGQSINSYLGATASSLGLSGLFEAATKALKIDDTFPRLKSVTTRGPWRIGRAEPEHQITVLEGPKEMVLKEWMDCCRIGEKLNDMDLYYVPLCVLTHGQNCNSVTALMLHAMNVDFDPNQLDFAAIGFSHKLHQSHAPLAKFDINAPYDPHTSLEDLLDDHIDKEGNHFWLTSGGKAMQKALADASERNADTLVPEA